jgi:hypothetical protein
VARALVFCPNSSGHRQVYACVYADFLRRRGLDVTMALGEALPGEAPARSPVVEATMRGGAAHLRDLGDCSGTFRVRGAWVEPILRLEGELRPVLTILPTGDEARLCLAGLGAASQDNRPRRVGIFNSIKYVYAPDTRALPLHERARLAAKRARHVIDEASYYGRLIWDDLGLDIGMAISEEFVRRPEGRRYGYVPDLYREWLSVDGAVEPALDKAARELARFIEDRPGAVVLPYYGLRAARRGYDSLLALADGEPDTIVVSVGREETGERFPRDVEALRERLTSEGRMWERTVPFLPSSNPLVDAVYGSATIAVLPYRNFYCSSGAVLDAARLGVPCLVPDIGWMAARVRERRIGHTYRHLDEDDLPRRFRDMVPVAASYRHAALELAAEYGPDRLEAALARGLAPVLP